jgi:hypothetical protein
MMSNNTIAYNIFHTFDGVEEMQQVLSSAVDVRQIVSERDNLRNFDRAYIFKDGSHLIWGSKDLKFTLPSKS